MRAFILAAVLVLPVIEVYDGDTIKTRAMLPSPLDKVSIRVLGIDTPEMPAKSYEQTGKLGRAKCEAEAELAIAAKEVVQTMVDQSYGWMEVTNYKWGKFGGRIVGEVTINGASVREILLMKGMAVEYHGEKKTKDWCKEGSDD